MRLCFMSNQQIRTIHHSLGNVRMVIETNGNRNAITDHSTNGRQYVPFNIIFPIRGRGTV